MILTEQYKANREKVFELVKNFFGYSPESIEKFRELYYERERFIDETYKKIFNEETVDFKVRRKLTDELMKKIDGGYLLFNLWFSAFTQKYNVTYENFKDWKIEINKNSFKLQKALVNFYSDKKNFIPYAADIREIRSVECFKELRDKEEQIKRQLQNIQESISERRLPPNQELEFVISFDPADWLLASTAETWTSCLNLRSNYSSCYWHGLPALIGDPNRCMIYMTNKAQKEFLGIKADKIIARAWGLLASDETIYINKSYPSAQFSDDDISIIFPELNFGSIWALYNSRVTRITKKPITPLWLINNESDFIYNDLSIFRTDKTIEFGYVDGGHRVFYRPNKDSNNIDVIHRDHFSWTRGFEEIYKSGKDIISLGAHRSIRRCVICGEFKKAEYQLPNGSYVCRECYEHLPKCSSCGTRDAIENLIEYEGKLYCKHCFEREFRICSCCGKKGHKSGFVSNSIISEIVCKECAEKFYYKCPKCSTLTRIDKMKIKNGKAYCEACFNEEE